MRWFVRMIGCLTTIILLSVGLNTFAGRWLGTEGGALQLGRWLVFETRRAEALRHRSEMIAHAWEVKRDLIDEVVVGRMSLRQAILQFKQANNLVDNSNPGLVAPYYTPSDPESLGNQVLAWARNELAGWPPHKGERILMTLELEFQELFGRPSSPARAMCPDAEKSSGPIPAPMAD